MESLPLVLLPGIDGTGLLFKPFLAALPSLLTPQVVSYPGDVPLNYDELLARVMPALPRDRPYVLLGESFSGSLALRVAQQRPPGLRAVILCATFVHNPIRCVPAATRFLIRPLFIRLTPFTLLRRLLSGRGAGAAIAAQARAAIDLVSPAVFAARLRAVLTLNAESALQDCAVPMLYLQAKRDAVIGVHNIRRMLRLRPDLDVAIVDSPHWLLQTRPDEAVSALIEFLQRHELS